MFLRKLIYSAIWVGIMVMGIQFIACSDAETIITNIVANEVSAKERLDSANAQAKRSYGDSTKLVLILGKNVKSNGKTEISALTAITNPDSIGAWLYIYRVPQDTSLRVYTPNPIPSASDCIELTSFFNINSFIGLIQDTSARNIVSGALNILISSNISITTSSGNLIDSDNSLNLANTTNPIIRFDENFIPDTSSLNGSIFFSTGSNKSTTMFLIPAAGTLNLPQFIQNLTGFPNDLWIVQYKKTTINNLQDNLILGTVVESNQIMGISSLGLTSKVINISKYSEE